jgi:TolA-binding protein
MRTGRVRTALVATLAATLIWAVLAPPAPAQRRAGRPNPAAQQAPSGAAQLYSQGFFAYENFDTSDTAPNNFRQVIVKYPGSPEAESAQYFLGSFYQRKYQLKAKETGVGSADTLDEARRAYEDYIRKYPTGNGPCQCLSDAYFNLALVYFQLGKPAVARAQLEKIRSSYERDHWVYIYQVVSSPNQKDVIDSHFDAVRLADYTSKITGLPFDTAATLLKQWCRSEKSKS